MSAMLRNLDIPRGPISLSRLDSLAGLLDLLENGIVGERVFRENFGSLGLERHIVGLNACEYSQSASAT